MEIESKVDVLLVDDQPNNLIALGAVLGGMGLNLVEARSGEEALRRVLDGDFAVILMDVQMPGMDGFETAALIRERDRSSHTPIIFLTAFESSAGPGLPGVRPRGRRLPLQADRPGRPEVEGRGLRRPLPEDRAGEAPGPAVVREPAPRARARAGRGEAAVGAGTAPGRDGPRAGGRRGVGAEGRGAGPDRRRAGQGGGPAPPPRRPAGGRGRAGPAGPRGPRAPALLGEAVAQAARRAGGRVRRGHGADPRGDRPVLRAGVGWDRAVGSVAAPRAGRSLECFTVLADEPVVFEDLAAETRFDASPLLREHAVASGVSVVIQGRSPPLRHARGVLPRPRGRSPGTTSTSCRPCPTSWPRPSSASGTTRTSPRSATSSPSSSHDMTRLHALVSRLSNTPGTLGRPGGGHRGRDGDAGHGPGRPDALRPRARRDDDGGQRGFPAEQLAPTRRRRRPARGPTERSRRSSAAGLVVEDAASDPVLTPHLAAARRAGYLALCSTPLLTSGGELVGSIATYFPRPHRPTDRETRLVELYARQAAESIDNARLYREIREADRHKERVPGHARARAAQPPRAASSTPCTSSAWTTSTAPTAEQARDIAEQQVRHLARLVDDLLDVSRISSGKIQLRTEPVDLREVVARSVETARPHIDASPPRAVGVAPRGAHVATGGLGQARAGHRQPAEQRRQVHRTGGHDRARGRPRGRRGGGPGAGLGYRDRPGAAPARLRPVHPGGSLAGPQPGGSGHRPDPGAAAGRAARRERDRGESGPRPGQRVRRPPPDRRGRRRRGRPDGARVDTPRSRRATPSRNGCSSSTTTWTGRRSWPGLLKACGHRTEVAHDGPTALESRPPTRRTSSCWTSACRGWTATRSRGGSGGSRAWTGPCSWR